MTMKSRLTTVYLCPPLSSPRMSSNMSSCKPFNLNIITRFSDLKTGYTFETKYRYSQLKQFHESVELQKVQLPKFPPTRWFGSTNSELKLIEERREGLDQYFKEMMEDEQLRGCFLVRNFVKDSESNKDKVILRV